MRVFNLCESTPLKLAMKSFNERSAQNNLTNDTIHLTENLIKTNHTGSNLEKLELNNEYVILFINYTIRWAFETCPHTFIKEVGSQIPVSSQVKICGLPL